MLRLLRMPKGGGAAGAVLRQWLVDEASCFDANQMIATVETDDALVSVQAPRSGVVLKALVAVGARVEAGMPLAVLGDTAVAEAELDAFLDNLDHDIHTCEKAVHGFGIYPSPLVRRVPTPLQLVEHSNPSLSQVQRVYDALTVPRKSSPAPPQEERTSGIIDRVDFFLRASLEAEPLLTLVAELNEGRSAPVSLQHLVIKAVAAAHRRAPELQEGWIADCPAGAAATDIAVRLATREGPVKGVLRDVSSVTISAVAAQICQIAADDEHLVSAAFREPLFVVTDLDPSPEPPGQCPDRSAVLSIRVEHEETVAGRDTVTVTLSLAHGPTGPVAARWMAALLEELEHPVRLLA
jgi:pyruvate dehydrogenase E2 component (dihydrolipoamide acetyltransferase)